MGVSAVKTLQQVQGLLQVLYCEGHGQKRGAETPEVDLDRKPTVNRAHGEHRVLCCVQT